MSEDLKEKEKGRQTYNKEQRRNRSITAKRNGECEVLVKESYECCEMKGDEVMEDKEKAATRRTEEKRDGEWRSLHKREK